MDTLTRGISGRPIIAGANAIFADIKVLRVVDVLVRARLDAIDDLQHRVNHHISSLQDHAKVKLQACLIRAYANSL